MQPVPGRFEWTTPTGHRYATVRTPHPVGVWPEPWQLDQHRPDPDEFLDNLPPPTPHLTDVLLAAAGHDTS